MSDHNEDTEVWLPAYSSCLHDARVEWYRWRRVAQKLALELGKVEYATVAYQDDCAAHSE